MGESKLRKFIVIGLMAALASGCGGGASDSTGLSVVATTTILGDVARGVAGDDARVEVLFPVGVDPHEYQPSSQQVAAISSADLVVANGLGLEAGLVDVLATAHEDGARVLELGPLLDPRPLGGGDGACDTEAVHEHEHGDEADHGACDPHVWLDPLRMAEGAYMVADELTALDASKDWEGRAAEYAGRLEEADGEIQEILGQVPVGRRVLVTNHDNLGYFASRYGFEIVGTIVPGGATLAEPSSEELAALVEAMRGNDVTVVIAETIEPTTLADAVADELGEQVQVVELYTDSLGEPGSGADTLAGMLTVDAERIAAALGGG